MAGLIIIGVMLALWGLVELHTRWWIKHCVGDTWHDDGDNWQDDWR